MKISNRAVRITALNSEWMMNIRDEYKTVCGGIIKIPSETKEHLLVHPEVGELLEEVLGQLRLPENGGFLARSEDLGRPVGLSACVPAPRVGMDDVATFASRINRPRPSRVLVGAEKVPTSEVTLIAAPEGAGVYTLITAWVGPLAPKEPGDAEVGPERDASLDFWSNNALVWDPATAGEPQALSWRQVLKM